MKRALIAIPIAVASLLGACGDAEPSTDSLRHVVCNRLAAEIGSAKQGVPSSVEPLRRTIPRELRVLRNRDAKGYEEFADVIEEWVGNGGQDERTRVQVFVVLSRTCAPELHDQRAAVCRSDIALYLTPDGPFTRHARLVDVLDGSEEVCHAF